MADTPQDRWTRVEAIVDRALDLPASERAGFVREACGEDEGLRQSAEDWLAACENPSLFPEAPAAEFAAPLLSGGVEAPVDLGLAPGTRLGTYRIVRELGRGGMGSVLLAERDDGQLDRRVAVKVMRRGADDATLRRRFVDERQILARLDHPHIATLIDAGIAPGGRLYFVMQYVEGEPIDRYCEDKGLSVDDRLRLFVDVCSAVAYAHRHQVVHRDLKPGNILVTGDGHAKLLDFGIAKLLEPASSREDLTRTGERLLTPEYASPEQIRGDPVTPASDVHALGVLLHRLLTGQRPFRRQAATAHDLERAILEDDPTQPSDVVSAPRERRRLRGDLDAIVLTALRKDASQRYADAGQLGDDIRRHLDGHPVRARGRVPGYRLRAFLRQHQGKMAAAGVGAMLGVTVYAGSLWQARTRQSAGVVLAIGHIVDYRDSTDSRSAASLVDMLATNLARTEGLAVISASRISALLAGAASAEAHVLAARQAGATQVLNGTIYPVPGGGVRLDLQRIDVGRGTILGAHTASGADLFGLVDDATVRVVEELGLPAPAGSITTVTTRSLAAYRRYVEGLAHFQAERLAEAEASFGAALREDTSFAMAAFYHARSANYQWRFASATSADRAEFEARSARAVRLALRASDRERLMIRTFYEVNSLSPASIAVAETLAVRYPQEIDGHMMLGTSRTMAGELRSAIPDYERVLAMDSAAMAAGDDLCGGCRAIESLVEVATLMDSVEEAERYARRWLALQPGSSRARRGLAQVLDAQGRHADAAALLQGSTPGRSPSDSIVDLAKHLIRAGELEAADTMLRTWSTKVSGADRSSFIFYRAIVLQHQGRMREALTVARQLRAASGERSIGNAAPPSAVVEAQALLELGRMREASALLDSVARWPASRQPPSVQANIRVLALSMSAASLQAVGDTSRLAALADSLERDGSRVLLFRPRDQHHFVRGLLLVARGRDDEAIAAFRSALGHVMVDFGRANVALADLYLNQDRARDAIAVLRPASRGWFIETTNVHQSLTEVHERLALAHERAGAADSAAAHWARVAGSWVGADPELAGRQRRAVDRLNALGGTPVVRRR